MTEIMGYEWSSWRKHPRVIPAPDHPIVVHIEDEGLPAVLDVRDISEGGMELELFEPLPPDSLNREVSLLVALPPPTSVALVSRGRIRHMSENRVGVRFLRLSESDRQHLRSYVRERSRGESWLTRLRRSWWGNF